MSSFLKKDGSSKASVMAQRHLQKYSFDKVSPLPKVQHEMDDNEQELKEYLSNLSTMSNKPPKKLAPISNTKYMKAPDSKSTTTVQDENPNTSSISISSSDDNYSSMASSRNPSPFVPQQKVIASNSAPSKPFVTFGNVKTLQDLDIELEEKHDNNQNQLQYEDDFETADEEDSTPIIAIKPVVERDYEDGVQNLASKPKVKRDYEDDTPKTPKVERDYEDDFETATEDAPEISKESKPSNNRLSIKRESLHRPSIDTVIDNLEPIYDTPLESPTESNLADTPKDNQEQKLQPMVRFSDQKELLSEAPYPVEEALKFDQKLDIVKQSSNVIVGMQNVNPIPNEHVIDTNVFKSNHQADIYEKRVIIEERKVFLEHKGVQCSIISFQTEEDKVTDKTNFDLANYSQVKGAQYLSLNNLVTHSKDVFPYNSLVSTMPLLPISGFTHPSTIFPLSWDFKALPPAPIPSSDSLIKEKAFVKEKPRLSGKNISRSLLRMEFHHFASSLSHNK